MRIETDNIRQADFVIGHIDLLEEYDLRDLFQKLFAKAFNHATGLYVDEKGRLSGFTIRVKKKDYSTSEAWSLNFNLDVNENIQMLTQDLEAKGITLDEFKAYYEIKSVFTSYYFRRNEKSFSMSHSGNSSLIYFLRFLVNGKADDDLKESHDLMEEKKIRYDQGNYELQIGNIKIKSFLNGRIDLKGLTPMQENMINRFYDIYEIVTDRKRG